MFLILTLVFAQFCHASEAPNFHQVEVGLYRGGRPSDVATLASLGVKTDVDLQGGDLENQIYYDFISWWEPGERPELIASEAARAQSVGIAFHNFPLNSLAPISAEEDRRIDEVLALPASPAARPIFIHCEHGKDRTGLVIALYRVKYEGWSVQKAYQEWLDLGHGQVSRIFTGNLDTYFFKKVL